MKFATYLLPFFLAVSSSLAKDSTTRNRKLGPLVAAGGNAKTSKAPAAGVASCGVLFDLLTRQKIVKGLLMSFYEDAVPDFGMGFTLLDRQTYIQSFPAFEQEFVKIGIKIGKPSDTDVLWSHNEILEYFLGAWLELEADTGIDPSLLERYATLALVGTRIM